MKKLATKGYYILFVVCLFLGTTLTVKAQFSGTNLETGGLYTAMTRDAARNLYITRVTPGSGGDKYKVEKYSNGTGNPTTIYSGLTHEVDDFPWGLAVTSTGNVFISTDFTTAGGKIIQLTKSGTTYTATTYQTGKYFTALAVDASDNLYDTEYDAVHKTYAVVEYPANSAPHTAGTRLYDNLKSAAGYTYPTGLAIAANGDVYVADAFSNDPNITDGGHVYKLTAASSYAVSTVSSGNYSTALCFDASGNLYSNENRGAGYSIIKYAGATGAGAPFFNGLHTNGIYYPWGLADYSLFKVYTVDGDDGTNGGAIIEVLPTPPTVTTNAATAITATTATLNGVVNDNNNNTTVKFLYGTSPTLAGATSKPATTGATINAGAGNTPVTLSATGLAASTTYYYAVSATNAGGTIQGSILSFLTLPSLSYTTPQSYKAGITIPPLMPVSSAVPAPAYGGNVLIGSGFNTPFGVAGDAMGNVYVADYGNELIKEIPVGGGAPVTLLTGFTTGLGVAVDAAGNLYVADAGNTTINKYLAGTTTPVAIGTGFNAPYGIAVDGKGNVYVADYGASAVYKIPVGGGPQVAIGTGFSNPTGVAVDGAGNVYVADYTNKLVKEIQASGGATISIGSGFSAPVGVGVDPSGNVFVADYGNSSVVELPMGGGAPIALGSGYANPSGVAVDGLGRVIVANYLASNIEQLTPLGGYYLSAVLPAGLAFDSATGIISGTPAVISPATNYNVTAYNTGGSTTTTVNIAVTANAMLTNLSLSNGTLSPAFSNSTTSYTASVANSVLSVAVTPTTSDPAATVTVNGVAVASGTPSGPVNLSVGPNTITTKVTAQDGTTTQTFTVTVTRAPSSNAGLANLSINSGTLTPAFSTGITSYTVADGSVSTVKITPTVADPGATVTVNGVAVASGTMSGAITLSPGANVVTVVVTAQDGVTKQTYTVTVGQGSNDAYLSNLTVQTATLSPAYAFKTLSYTASVPNSTSSVTVTPSVIATGATVMINGTAVANKAASGPIALVVGTNPINVVVTAPDGVSTQTYSIVITRAPSTNDDLANLSISAGTLTPVFASGTTSYSASAGNAASVKITPTVADPTATVTVNGVTVTSGTASGSITLNTGTNSVYVVVTAQDGVSQKTYNIIVGKGGSDAYLSNLTVQTATLSPAFAFKTLSYTSNVPNSTSSVTVTPSLIDVTASSLTVNGTIVANKTASGPIALAVGANTINVVIIAQDGVATITYTLTITRASGGSDSFDPGLSVNNPADKPSFDDDIIAVHQGISPNGDGVNDFLVIDGIQAYPDNKLSIMNRNGQLIFETKGYDNSSKVFDGHSSKNGRMQLPGTYFYQLDYTVNGAVKHKTGFIVLKY